jgi:intraflagellar transport protein 81
MSHIPLQDSTDLDRLHREIQEVTAETNTWVEKRMLQANPKDDQLAMFRQQAALIARKKASSAEKLEEMQSRLTRIKSEIEEKQAIRGDRGPRMLKDDEFKRYVSELREKSAEYRRAKGLVRLTTHPGVLTRSTACLFGLSPTLVPSAASSSLRFRPR